MIAMERKGFTLIEILIVVAIIAILASIVLVGLGPTQQSGRDARRLSDLHEIQNGLELYYNACGYYPGTATVAPCLAYKPITVTPAISQLAIILTSFSSLGVNSIPDDPTSGQHYTYSAVPGGTSYILSAKLENANNSVFNSYTPPANAAQATDGDGAEGCAATGPQFCISI
jgi:prepilin-type N-terminal cleavage/methylation domain-containing protein